VVVPDALQRAFLNAKAAMDTGAAGLEQAALAEFLVSGQLERHVRKTRLRNAARHEAVTGAIAAQLADRVRMPGTHAGLHVWFEVPSLPPSAASKLRRAALARGVSIYSSGRCYASEPRCAGFVLGYANLSTAQIARGIERLAEAFDDVVTPAAARVLPAPHI
jgi:GntR family transcriptional regulator/MocR family aminotransferase